jgi:hypothetical protein
MVDVRGGRLSDPSSWIQYELTSQIDGITDTFTIPVAYISGKILVFLNGIERIVGATKDYTELSDTQIKFNYVPEVIEKLEVWIIKK